MENSLRVTLGAASGRKEERQTEDFYASDSRAAAHIFNKIPDFLNCDKIVEPCAGDGTMADKIREITGKQVDMYDIVSRRKDIIEANYFELNIKDRYNLIITNPPYRKGSKTNPGLTPLILKMLDDVRPDGYVALLLKTLHLESQERYSQIYSKMPPEQIYVYAPRICCYKNNDTSYLQGAISYSWFIWHKNNDGTYSNKPPVLGWIDKL